MKILAKLKRKMKISKFLDQLKLKYTILMNLLKENIIVHIKITTQELMELKSIETE